MTKTPILDHFHDLLHKDQIQNLRKLSDYLLENAYFLQSTGRFDMGTYAENESREETLEIEDLISGFNEGCKTVGCAAGHGPLAGVKSSKSCNGWEEYIEEEFTSAHRTLYVWFFECDWEKFDPTPYGAGLRIKAFLDKDPRLENFFNEYKRFEEDFNPIEEPDYCYSSISSHALRLYRTVEVDDDTLYFGEHFYFLRDEVDEWLKVNNLGSIKIDHY
nr:hypothetical protein ORM20_00031 [Ochrobactrum phage ORM_20]